MGQDDLSKTVRNMFMDHVSSMAEMDVQPAVTTDQEGNTKFCVKLPCKGKYICKDTDIGIVTSCPMTMTYQTEPLPDQWEHQEDWMPVGPVFNIQSDVPEDGPVELLLPHILDLSDYNMLDIPAEEAKVVHIADDKEEMLPCVITHTHAIFRRCKGTTVFIALTRALGLETKRRGLFVVIESPWASYGVHMKAFIVSNTKDMINTLQENLGALCEGGHTYSLLYSRPCTVMTEQKYCLHATVENGNMEHDPKPPGGILYEDTLGDGTYPERFEITIQSSTGGAAVKLDARLRPEGQNDHDTCQMIKFIEPPSSSQPIDRLQKGAVSQDFTASTLDRPPTDQDQHQQSRPEPTGPSPPRTRRYLPTRVMLVIITAIMAIVIQLFYTGHLNDFFRLLNGGKHVHHHMSYSGKPVVLLVNDEYGTSKGGISTINRQLAKLLSSSGAKAICTVLNASKEDTIDANANVVELILPTTFEADERQPNINWLTFDHLTRYPNLPSGITHIIGHSSITSSAARKIRAQRYPTAKLILFNHVIPEDTEHYKSESRALDIEEKSDAIRKDMKHADVIFSVGPYLHDYYQTQVKGLKPHYQFLPKPSKIFSQLDLKYVETETKVVLSIGRVKGAERLKGYDLAAKAMSIVIEKFPKAKWRVRGVSAEDFTQSKVIIDANIEKGKFHFTALKYGTQHNLSIDMSEAHLVLMPSRAEPFGLVGLEAIAAGVPLIVSDTSGLAWFLKSQNPDFDRSIINLKGEDEEDAKVLAKRIEEILKDGQTEFNAAKGLKQKLLSSKYWEDSHRQFLEECGIR